MAGDIARENLIIMAFEMWADINWTEICRAMWQSVSGLWRMLWNVRMDICHVIGCNHFLQFSLFKGIFFFAFWALPVWQTASIDIHELNEMFLLCVHGLCITIMCVYGVHVPYFSYQSSFDKNVHISAELIIHYCVNTLSHWDIFFLYFLVEYY